MTVLKSNTHSSHDRNKTMTMIQLHLFCQRPLRSKPPSCSPYPSPSHLPTPSAWQVGQQVSEGSSNDRPPLPCGWRWRLAPLTLDSEGSWAMKCEVDFRNREMKFWKWGSEELPWMKADGRLTWRDDVQCTNARRWSCHRKDSLIDWNLVFLIRYWRCSV